MKREKQLNIIENYLREREKSHSEYKIGVEFEHFIVDRDSFRTITYYDEEGIVDTLEELVARGWEGYYEDGYILGASKGSKVISLEPGSQFEFSIVAKATIGELEEEYKDFLKEIEKILNKKNQTILALGYHPVSKIDEIKLLPKKRYDYMFDYFKTKGSYAHNMMKGSGALQVSIDYENEEDYRKKLKVANSISPIIAGITSNSFYFEGEEFPKENLRLLIWTNMDDMRSGVVKGSMDKDFSYRRYGEYLLDVEPIFTMKDGKAINTGKKTIGDLLNPADYTIDELEHLMTMVFPDVRTKGFIEIRMMDSIPIDFSFSMVALIKSLFYNNANLDRVYEIFKDFTEKDIRDCKLEVIEKGQKAIYKDKTINSWARDLYEIGKDGLDDRDLKFLEPMLRLVDNENTLREIIDSKMGRKK